MEVLKGESEEGESQRKVDAYIKQKIKDILVVSGTKRNETIITNIRNRIAHPDQYLSIEKVKLQAEKYLDNLKDLVLEILRE